MTTDLLPLIAEPSPEPETATAVDGFHRPGVYHGMPFAEYLADPALSSGGIRDLRVSPLTYWANSPLNPDREQRESPAMTEGTAFHKRILEGRGRFSEAYAPELDPNDHASALKSGDRLRAHCERLGLKKSGTLAELSRLIRQHDPDVPLWTEIEAEHQARHADKAFLPRKVLARIEAAAQSIEADPATAALFRDGEPEVSIFWEDQETGVRLKARLDYLTATTVADLKTFSNAQNRPLKDAVSYAVAANGYGTQAVHYLHAVDRCEGVHGHPRFVFVFLENGIAPNVLAREFTRDAVYFEIVEQEYRQALRFYRQCLDRWGTAQPWVSAARVEPFRDEDFPLWSYTQGR